MNKGYQRKIQCLCLLILEVSVFLFVGFSKASVGEKALANQNAGYQTSRQLFQRGKIPARLAVRNLWSAPKNAFLVWNSVFLQPSPKFSPERTDSAFIESIMALLATFESANVLPAEGTSEGNQLIHGLIQLQSSLVRSQASELNEYISAAVAHSPERKSGEFLQSIQEYGLTSKVLEAILIYDEQKPIWNQPDIASILQRYNVSQQDWQLIEQIFFQADAVYRVKGSSIHKVYEQWRLQIRGDR